MGLCPAIGARVSMQGIYQHHFIMAEQGCFLYCKLCSRHRLWGDQPTNLGAGKKTWSAS